jgi:hypothetical protein
MIQKKGCPISCLDDWARLGGPKAASQWQEGRSAMELARSWLGVGSPTIPREIAEALSTNAEFGPVIQWSAEPEVQLRFDAFAGGTRNTDLFVRAEDSRGHFLIAVEGKADEPFGETVAQAYGAAGRRSNGNPRSGALERVRNLITALFDTSIDAEPAVGSLRYQLLTATAGVIAAARRVGQPRTILLVQEFRTQRTTDSKLKRNARDLDAFLRRLTTEQLEPIEIGRLYGPLSLTPSSFFPVMPPFFVAKVRCDLTSGTGRRAV